MSKSQIYLDNLEHSAGEGFVCRIGNVETSQQLYSNLSPEDILIFTGWVNYDL